MTFEMLSRSYGQLVFDAFETAELLIPLKSLRLSFREDLFQHVAVQTIFANEVVFEEGTIDNQHIYLQNGEVELQYPDGRIERLDASASFSPLAHRQPRPCRCLALTDGSVMRIDSDRMDRTISWSQIADYLLSELALERNYDDDIEWMQTVLNSNLFLKAPPVNAGQIFSRMTPMVVQEGDVIITQGDVGDCCYFIKEGDAMVTSSAGLSQNEFLAEIGPGRCFGEDSLVKKTVRNATITMTTDGILMRLEKSDFLLLLQEPAVDEVSCDDIRQMIEDPTYIDIRTEDEYAAGHLSFAANIPLSLLSIKKRLLAPEKVYVLYCDTGRRSCAAAYLLGKLGYNVLALHQGVIGQGLEDQLVVDDNYIIRQGKLVPGQ